MRKAGCLQLRVAILPRHRLERHPILQKVLQVCAERIEPVLRVIISRCRGYSSPRSWVITRRAGHNSFNHAFKSNLQLVRAVLLKLAQALLRRLDRARQ